MGNTKVIKAELGSMYSGSYNRYLYLELFNGYSYEEVDPKNPKKRIDLPFARTNFKFKKSDLTLPLSNSKDLMKRDIPMLPNL